MPEKRGVKALQIWCRRVTAAYDNVNILDMDSSWRDGLAFCAIIHHFRPSLLDYSSLSSSNILHNNELAFTLAEEKLGLPSLLDPQDMVDTDIPDKFSIITYVSQFYHLLKDEDNSRSPCLPAKQLQHAGSLDTSTDSDCSPVGTPVTVPRSVFTSSNPLLANNKFSPRHQDTALASQLQNKLVLSSHAR